MKIASIIATVFALAAPATAFEYSGLRSGMTMEEAQASLASGGHPPLNPVRNMQGLYTLGQPSTSTVNVTFCQGVLFALTSKIAGGVDAYTQMAVELTSRYGNPALQPTQQYTDQGLLSSMRLTWLTPDNEEVSVDLTSYQNRVSASRSFSAFQNLCPRS